MGFQLSRCAMELNGGPSGGAMHDGGVSAYQQVFHLRLLVVHRELALDKIRFGLAGQPPGGYLRLAARKIKMPRTARRAAIAAPITEMPASDKNSPFWASNSTLASGE